MTELYTSLVIALAPTDTAKDAAGQGIELARALGTAVHLVCAFDDRGGQSDPRGGRPHAEGRLESAAIPLRAAGLRVSTHALPGDPADAVLQVAQEMGADMIVVGNKGAQGARRRLGSVAASVLAHAPCAVTVVKTT